MEIQKNNSGSLSEGCSLVGKIITLAGFMGCGKSTVGKILARRLCMEFLDLDEMIEEASKKSIPEIFASQGEKAFRQMEADTLERFLSEHDSIDKSTDSLIQEKGTVLSLGGGTLTTQACRSMLHGRTICIYLKASIDTLARNLSGESEGRPMLKGTDEETALKERIRSLMAQRASIYEKAANHIIEVDNLSPEAVADAITSAIL